MSFVCKRTRVARKETHMNAVDILKYGQQTVLGTLEGLPEAAWEQEGACGVWSVKDIIAHLASYEMVLVERVNSFNGKSPTPTLSNFIEMGSQFNDAEVNTGEERTITRVLGVVNEAHAASMLLIA